MLPKFVFAEDMSQGTTSVVPIALSVYFANRFQPVTALLNAEKRYFLMIGLYPSATSLAFIACASARLLNGPTCTW